MKKYKFKLDALLTIRKLKEEQCKMQIGKIQVRIAELEKEIIEQDSGIDEAYSLQEQSLAGGAGGLEVRFHPYFVEGKRRHIEGLEHQKMRLQYHVQQKFLELNQLRANVKVIDKMKEKDFTKYKKDLNKRMDRQVEEQVQNWNMTVNKDKGL